MAALQRAVDSHASLAGHSDSGTPGAQASATVPSGAPARRPRRLPGRDTSTGRFTK